MKKNFILEKVYHEFQQDGGFFQCAVWVRQITRVLQTYIARRSKVQMVKTQTNSLNNQSGFHSPLRSTVGWLVFFMWLEAFLQWVSHFHE